MTKKKYSAQTAEQWYGGELRLYSQVFSQLRTHEQVKEYFFNHNVLNELRQSSAKRRFDRIARRAKCLGEEGLDLLCKASIADADALILMSYLRAYRFPYEFVFEHLCYKFSESRQSVFASEVDYFYEHKHTQFPDELNWSFQSLKRMRTQVLNMLVNGQLLKKIDTGGYELQKLLLSGEVHRFFLRNLPFETIVI